jgi:methyltransferase (TIGR00027 family)
MNGVGLTSLWVAAMRAVESERDDALVRDPFARTLAGEQGFEVLTKMDSIGLPRPPTIAVRTRWLDEQIQKHPRSQVVILAAGMDARAFRLDWPRETIVFEIDQPAVLTYKDERIGAAPRCDRRTVPIDLAEDWPAAVVDRGLLPSVPTLWIVEGLLPYLRETDVATLIARIGALSAVSSVFLADCAGRSLLDSPLMKARNAAMEQMGAPWLFGTDEPETLLPPSWESHVKEFSTVGNELGRWPFPPVARGTPGVPQSFLIEATRER